MQIDVSRPGSNDIPGHFALPLISETGTNAASRSEPVLASGHGRTETCRGFYGTRHSVRRI